ncbi:aldo/keto reductase [Rhodococcoides yunnanense]|uniref:aldo/keto reductase n=1 Tax=Rhodococcoides yunnanense TaxID=278209 RepID=UPI00093526C2|nr:aldo/keto reductase [Rhodococcus yunnanensis]
MEQRTLGSHGLVCTAIGMGCMGLSQGYGEVDDGASTNAIHAALDSGIDMFDTAMSYGQGHNESLLGRALAGHNTEVKIATKFGIVRGDDGVALDGAPEHVRRHCDASLTRLGVDSIDLYYLHRVDPRVPIEDTIGAMADLVTAGKVRYLGVSEVTEAQLSRAVRTHPISAVQFEWSMMWREPERSIVPHARRLGVGLVPYSPLGRGLLTATLHNLADIGSSPFRKNDPRFNDQNLVQNLTQVQHLQTLAVELGMTAGQLALAWLLSQGDDIVPIPGSRRADRIAENAAAADFPLTEKILGRIENVAPALQWSGDRSSFAVPTTSRQLATEGNR